MHRLAGRASLIAVATTWLGLASTARAQNVPPRVCSRTSALQTLEPDGSYRCQGLPLTVRFPVGVGVNRIETANTVTLQAKVEHGMLMFVHRIFPWGGLNDVTGGLDTFLTKAVLGSLGWPSLKVDTPSPWQVSGVDAARLARFSASDGDKKLVGEARVYQARTWMVAQVSFGRPDSPWAPEAIGAKDFFGSFHVEPQSAPIDLVLEGGMKLTLPPESWEVLSAAPKDPQASVYTFHVADPPAMLQVRHLRRDFTACDQAMESEAAQFRRSPKINDVDFDPAGLVRQTLPYGAALSIEADQRGTDYATRVYLYLICREHTLVQFSVATPRGVDGSHLARAVVESLSPVLQKPAGVTSGVLRIAMSGDYWPLHAGTGNQRAGLEADLARALAAEMQTTPVFLDRPQTGVGSIDAVALGKADIALSAITPTAERKKLVDFSDAYLTLQLRLARRADTPDVELPGLAGKRVAVPTGPTLDALRSRLSKSKLIPVDSLDKGVKLVRNKKADFVIGEDVGLLLAMEGTDLVLGAEQLLGGSPLAMAVPKGQAANYNAALRRISGEVARLVEVYNPGKPMQPQHGLTISFCGERGHVTVTGGGPLYVNTEGKLEVRSEGGSDGPWYLVDWKSPVAAPMQPGSVAGDGEICVDSAARLVPTTTRAQQAYKRAADAYRAQGSTGLHLSEPEGWLKLYDGTLVGVASWSRTQTCGGEESDGEGGVHEYSYDCPEGGYLVVAARGAELDWEAVQTYVEGT